MNDKLAAIQKAQELVYGLRCRVLREIEQTERALICMEDDEKARINEELEAQHIAATSRIEHTEAA